MAQRAMISRTTLVKVENGDSGVSLGIFATVLFVLGMTDRLADIADASHDRIGLDLESENLPKRISSPRKPKHGPGNRIFLDTGAESVLVGRVRSPRLY